jgi:hypothetical protein
MIEVLKQALEALEFFNETAICFADTDISNEAITSLRQAIAELESQEPVAYINVEKRILEWAKLTSWETPTVVNLPKIPLYTHPPQRTWVGLTDEEVNNAIKEKNITPLFTYRMIARTIEAKLKEKNGFDEENT